MRVRLPMIAAFFAVLRLAPAAFAGFESESFGDRYLVKMRVHASDGDFISFLPKDDGKSRVWSDERKGHWKKRVADLVRPPDEAEKYDAAYVSLCPFDQPFDAIPYENSLRPFLLRGMNGVGTIPFADGSLRTNRFEVAEIPKDKGTVRMRWKGEGASFVLRAGQGAWREIWFVKWNDVAERWSNMLGEKHIGEVRSEMEAILVSGRLSSDGGAIWKGRLDGFLGTHPEMWPGIAFTNTMDQAVVVSYDGGGSGKTRKLAPGEVWVAKVDKAPDAGKGIPWSFVRADRVEHPDEFEFEPITTWRMDAMDNFPVAIHNTARRSKGVPRLTLGSGLIPSEVVKRLLPDQPVVQVVYGENAEPTPLAIISVASGDRYVEVDAHRPIKEFVIDCPYCDKARIRPMKAEYGNGERVELDGKPKLTKWPRLVLRNPLGDRAVTNVVTYHLPGETRPLPGSRPRIVVLVPKGGKGKNEEGFDPAPGEGAEGLLELEVRIATSAAYAKEEVATISKDKFYRGASPVELAPRPAQCAPLPKAPVLPTFPMPSKKDRSRPPIRMSGNRDKIVQFDAGTIKGHLKNEMKNLPDNMKKTIYAVREHFAPDIGKYVACKDNKSECQEFRKHLRAVEADFEKLTEKAVFLACLREYLISEYLNNNRDLTGQSEEERKKEAEKNADQIVKNWKDELTDLPDNWTGLAGRGN